MIILCVWLREKGGEKIGWAQEFSSLALQNIISPNGEKIWRKCGTTILDKLVPVHRSCFFLLAFVSLFFPLKLSLKQPLMASSSSFSSFPFLCSSSSFFVYFRFFFHPFIFPHLFWFLLLLFFNLI